MSKKQFINASNKPPSLGLGTILLWFMAIDYYAWPDWTYGVWGVCTLSLVVSFIYRLATEEGIDIVKR